jgi:outer membrane lipoprotein-sorting protein
MPTQSSKILRYAGLALLPLTFLLTASAQEGGLSVDDIVKKHIDANGGMDKIKALQSVKMSGKLVMGGGQMEMTTTIEMKRPNLMRSDTVFQGQSVVQAYDGKTAWTINPFTGGADAQKMNDDEAAALIERTDMDGLLIGYKEKGHKITLSGKEDLAGKPAYKLIVVKKNGKTTTIYIDATSFMEVKRVETGKFMDNEMEMETFISDYKPVNGFLMPYSMDTKTGGNSVFTLTLDKIEANVAIDDAIFKMPAAK